MGARRLLFVHHKARPDTHDCENLHLEIGNCSAQRTAIAGTTRGDSDLEALWQKDKVLLSIRADNMTVLKMIDRSQPALQT